MSLSGTDSVDAADPNTSTLPSRNLSLQKQRTKKGPGMDFKKSRGYRWGRGVGEAERSRIEYQQHARNGIRISGNGKKRLAAVLSAPRTGMGLPILDDAQHITHINYHGTSTTARLLTTAVDSTSVPSRRTVSFPPPSPDPKRRVAGPCSAASPPPHHHHHHPRHRKQVGGSATRQGQGGGGTEDESQFRARNMIGFRQGEGQVNM